MSMRQARVDIQPGIYAVLLGKDIGIKQTLVSEWIHAVNLEKRRG